MSFTRVMLRILPWIRRFWIVASVLMVSPFLILVTLFLWEKISWKTDRDHALFESVCDHCHPPMRAHRYAKSPDEWRSTVLRMLSKDSEYGKHIDLDKRERIIGMLIRTRSASPRVLYHFRCGQCHSRSVIEPYLDLDEKTLSVLVSQHNRQMNYAIQAWEGDLIAQRISEMRERRAPVKTVSSRGDQYLFQKDCGICHTVRFMYRTMCLTPRDDQKWTDLTVRMQEKSPEYISKDEVPALMRQAKMICETKKVAP
jgi:hypothetical protein